MYWRPFRESDLSECLNMQPACIGDAITGRGPAMELWKTLVHHPAFLATVIDSDRLGVGMAGCGLGVFVSREFADNEIRAPKPGLNDRLLAAANREILDHSQIALGNAGLGLDFVNLYGTWKDGVLHTEELNEVQALLGIGFTEQFRGYRFSRVLKEAVGVDRIAHARATGTYRIIAEFPERTSALVAATPETAATAPYSVAASLFRYQPPVLRLRPAEQELLAAALEGKTDADLSEELGVSIEATKKRWLSVFDRVLQYRPEILGTSEIGTGRGPQKRHRVVAYVRNHMEELRPYAWS